MKLLKPCTRDLPNVLNLYTRPPGELRKNDTFVLDLAKFLGHELFIIFFSFLIQNRRWELIEKLLDGDLYARVHDFSYPEFVRTPLFVSLLHCYSTAMTD